MDFRELLHQVSRNNRRRYAGWDAELFQEISIRIFYDLYGPLRKDPQLEELMPAVLELLGEALARGYLDHRWQQGRPRSLMQLLFTDLIPQRLPLVTGKRRLACLARAWNLAEGLRTQPAWLDGFVTSQGADLTDLDQLEGWLVTVLQKAMTKSVPPPWNGPFQVEVLNARDASPDFLPGPMHAVAPQVVCVHDRRSPRSRLQVYLHRAGKSVLAGPFACDYRPEETAINFSKNRALVDGQSIELPLLGQGHSGLRQGAFFLASAIDSQRLWVAEAAR